MEYVAPEMNVDQGTCSVQWPASIGGIRQVQTHPRNLTKVWGWVAVHAPPNVIRVSLDGNVGPDYGPVDVPAIIAFELPVVLLLERTVVDTNAVTASVSWGVGCPPYQGRGRVLTLVALTPTALAPWESEADLVNPAATADWLTAGGAVITTFAVRGYRPLGATQIQLSLNTDVRLRAG